MPQQSTQTNTSQRTPSSVAPHKATHPRPQFSRREGLFETTTPKALRKLGDRVAGDEKNRHSAPIKFVSQALGRLTVQIEVQNRGVGIDLGHLGGRHRGIGSRPQATKTLVKNSTLQHVRYEKHILDHQDRGRRFEMSVTINDVRSISGKNETNRNGPHSTHRHTPDLGNWLICHSG